MAPISAELKVCWRCVSLEAVTDMAGLRLSEPRITALTGRVHIINADEPIRNCDGATMLALRPNCQQQDRANRTVHRTIPTRVRCGRSMADSAALGLPRVPFYLSGGRPSQSR